MPTLAAFAMSDASVPLGDLVCLLQADDRGVQRLRRRQRLTRLTLRKQDRWLAEQLALEQHDVARREVQSGQVQCIAGRRNLPDCVLRKRQCTVRGVPHRVGQVRVADRRDVTPAELVAGRERVADPGLVTEPRRVDGKIAVLRNERLVGRERQDGRVLFCVDRFGLELARVGHVDEFVARGQAHSKRANHTAERAVTNSLLHR
jgi:hypothetical protein